MSIALRDEIVEEFCDAQTRWTTSRRNTKAVVLKMKKYYANRKGTSDVIMRTREDKETIIKHLTEHQKISGIASNISKDLSSQVESSEKGVENMKKFGLAAAVGFTVLGVIIGAGIGFKGPGFGQTIAIVVAIVVGGCCFGFFAFVLYFVMRRRAQRKENMWKVTEDQNQEGLNRLAAEVQSKRTCLGEIKNLLGDLKEVDNFVSTVEQLMNKMDEYLKDN